MEDLPVLTLITTLILMFLTLSTMFLLTVSSFDNRLGSYLSLIWRFISIVQALVGGWSIIIGMIWLLYLFLFDKEAFLTCQNDSQIFVYILTLVTIIVLLMLSGFIGTIVSLYLNPAKLAIRSNRF